LLIKLYEQKTKNTVWQFEAKRCHKRMKRIPRPSLPLVRGLFFVRVDRLCIDRRKLERERERDSFVTCNSCFFFLFFSSLFSSGARIEKKKRAISKNKLDDDDDDTTAKDVILFSSPRVVNRAVIFFFFKTNR